MASVSFEHVGRRNKNNKKNKPYYFKKKKQPLVLVFDEGAREEFLTGFRKRKLQRKKKAQEDLEVQLKAERKRIKQEAKDAFKKLVVSHRDIPELGQVNEDNGDIVDMDTHEVKVTELDPERLARENNWIGANKIKYEEAVIVKQEPKHKEADEDEIEGMETTLKRSMQQNKTEPDKNNLKRLKTTKDIKKFVKNVATKNVQKSKIFQRKKDVEARKNKKKKIREERNREKTMKKIKPKREKKRN